MAAGLHPYTRLGGGDDSSIHNPRITVPREPHLVYDPGQETWCPIGGGQQLYYNVYGRGRTRVLLIMGLGGTHTQWEAQIKYFGVERGDDYTVCAFDNRGIGFSGSPPGRWKTTTIAADAVRLALHLGWGSGDVHLVGMSLGGMAALEAVLAHPALFASVTLISTHAGGPRGTIPPPYGFKPFVRTFASRGTPGSIDAGLDLLFPAASSDVASGRPPADPGAPATVRYERGRELVLRARKYVESGVPGAHPPQRLPGILRQVGCVLTHYVSRARLAALRRGGPPALVVSGRLDNLIQWRNSERLAAALGARHLHFADAGHGVNEQHAAEVNSELVAFFAAAAGAPRRATLAAPPGGHPGPPLLLLALLLAYVRTYVREGRGWAGAAAAAAAAVWCAAALRRRL